MEITHPLLRKATSATRESREIEFKREFDPTSRPQWCEIIKDIVAIANSGGGVIVFGLEDNGAPSGKSVQQIENLDPADVVNQLTGFTGVADWELEIISAKKVEQSIVAFLIGPSLCPVVFEKPGVYDPRDRARGSAFAQGSLYFRHGAKSEPARAADLPHALRRRLLAEKRAWMTGIKKVVTAPTGSRMLVLPPGKSSAEGHGLRSVRSTDDPNAAQVIVTRDAGRARGTFLHEQVSGALFDEINNIIDANRILAKGQKHFFLGLPVYYRIYADRELVRCGPDDFELLLRCALIDNYLPGLYWSTKVLPEIMGETLGTLFLHPRNVQTQYLMRVALLLGEEFCEWLFERWNRKWKRHIQKPSFFTTFQQMRRRVSSTDPVILASRIGGSWVKAFPGEDACTVQTLLRDSDRPRRLLATACQRIFSGEIRNAQLRSVARDLDYLVHGANVIQRSEKIAKSFYEFVSDKEIGEVAISDSEV